MQQLPQIAKDRLRTGPRPDHPDADVLTAFAERSLPVPERAVVVEHLARCGDCREVLALALPEIEEAVSPVFARMPWFSAPVLRWGAIAAAFAVLVTVGVMSYQRVSSNSVASARPGPTLPGAKDKMLSAASAPSTSATEAQQQDALVKPSPATQSAPAATQTVTSQKERIAQPNGSQVKTESNTLAFAARAPSIPSQTETVEVASASPSVPPEQAASDSNQNQSQVAMQQGPRAQESQQPADQQPPLSVGREVVGKAKAPISSAAGASLSRNSGRSVQMAQAAAVLISLPRWMITSAGGLQKSYDQGKTWQPVSLNASSRSESPALQLEATTRAQKMSKAKKQNESVAPPSVLAISTSGLEIWAGAAGGVLYHSTDAGDHWTSSVLRDGNVFLTGDITSVEFTDAMHGKASTSTSEIWTTSNDGQSWSKQ
ncbi:MAG: zf-HC2 domain-containing protein [Candidatus Sulfotelmatobacter sp.]